MSLSGYLSDYSLAEIFHFVQDGNKTGVLSIESYLGLDCAVNKTHLIFVQSGRIMSVANEAGFGNRGLLKMMLQRRWLSPEQFVELETQVSLLREPLGTYLKSRNIVNAEQLTLLFNSQVIAASCKLFEVQQGHFSFDTQAPLAYAEMTGLSLNANEIALLGLRMLKNWSGLTTKLPAPESALQRFSTQLTGVRLDVQEFQVWKLALGEMSISTIAAQLDLEVAKVQQIGFRLSSIGLAQETTIEPLQPQIDSIRNAPTPICVGGGNATVPVSASFLSNLMGFLKKKG
jgi:hypothetical protein